MPPRCRSYKPLTPDGFYNATTDLDGVQPHWHANPVACIGVAAGGLLILDVDSKDNPWLAEHPERARSLLAAPTSITSSGGRHHVFLLPPGKIWRCSVRKLAPNVDIRTDGGYAVLPSSVREDGPYKWIEGCELEVPPDKLPLPPKWLCDALTSWLIPWPIGRRVRLRSIVLFRDLARAVVKESAHVAVSVVKSGHARILRQVSKNA